MERESLSTIRDTGNLGRNCTL